MKFFFEIRDKDIAGRIGRLDLNGKRIETPALMPVFNPKKPIISARELKKEFRIEVIMANAYMILKDPGLKKKAISGGIHKLLNFDGLIATDSGSYQLMSYGNVLTTNKEILEFQEKIGSDIGSFLDIPSLPDAYKARVEEQLGKTLNRAREAMNAKFLVNAGIQGSTYLDLRKKAAREIGKNFRLCAIGGIVKLMEEYRFPELVDIIATVKRTLPADRVIHAFGLGHPISFSLAAALGCDLFDSAAYVLYARDSRYLTEMGTFKLKKLEYLPCSCPVCNKYGLELKELKEEDKVRELARHNLYVSIEELNRVRQAIKENSLWDLLEMRVRAHPRLLDGFRRLMKHKNFLSTLDPITKKSSFKYLGPESRNRTEVVNAKERLKRVSSQLTIKCKPFGNIPAEILDLYPFGAIVEEKPRVKDIEKIKAIMEYQFGSKAGELIPSSVRIKRSRKTGRIRWLYLDKELIASVRASDHFIIPKDFLLQKLHQFLPYPQLRVVVDDEAAPFVKEGKSVFAKFLLDIGQELRSGDEILVVDKDDNLLRGGTLFLSPKEAKDFDHGMVARVR